MADSIPRSYLKERMDTLASEGLKVAFFVDLTGYNPLATTNTYTSLKAGGATEVSNSGTGYTSGGYLLRNVTSSVSGDASTYGAKITASATGISGATFTFRYSVIYNSNTGKIRGIKDHLSDKSIVGGIVVITWDAVNGIIADSFTVV